MHLPGILNAFAENDLPVLEGPHFVDEGCIIDGELKTFDELYFATQGEKIVWYIKNYPISSDISTIILMSADLGINPMIVNMKDKEKKYQYYFVQESPLPEDVAKIISQSNYRLQRIKEWLENMKTIININLKKKEDFYSRYSNSKLSSEITEFIYNECYGENYKNNIIINIYTKLKISNKEKNAMMDTIRRTFGLKVQDELYYYEKAKFKKTILFLIGIVLIIIYYLSFVEVVSEIILILGWLAIWESVYSFLSDSSKDYIRIYRLRKLASSRIYFVDSSDTLSNSWDKVFNEDFIFFSSSLSKV